MREREVMHKSLRNFPRAGASRGNAVAVAV